MFKLNYLIECAEKFSSNRNRVEIVTSLEFLINAHLHIMKMFCPVLK